MVDGEGAGLQQCEKLRSAGTRPLGSYRHRKPESAVLHQLISVHLESVLRALAMSVTLGDQAPTAVPIFGELNASLVVPLTGLDVLRLHDEFRGVRLIQIPGGAVLWEWPLHDGRRGYCLSCHQRGTPREVGADAFVCAYCGNLHSTDGLWVAALS